MNDSAAFGTVADSRQRGFIPKAKATIIAALKGRN